MFEISLYYKISTRENTIPWVVTCSVCLHFGECNGDELFIMLSLRTFGNSVKQIIYCGGSQKI